MVRQREYCGLCECEVEGTWLEHVHSEQHQENLADPGKTGGAKVRHDIHFEEKMKESNVRKDGR